MMDFGSDPKSKQEKIKPKQDVKVVLIALSIAAKTITRYRHYDDPVLRYTLLVDKFYILMESSIHLLEHLDLSDEERSKVECTCQIIRDEFSNLLEWIRSPSYTLEHECGKNMFKQAHVDFDLHVQPKSSNNQ